MGNNPGKFLGQLEKEVMEVVWVSNEPITVRIVFETISKKRKIAYTTVMTIMGRLAKKGFLKSTTSEKAYTYQATYSKDKFLTRISRQIIKNLEASFGDAAIANFTKEIEKIPVEKRRKLIKKLKKANGNL